jgi:hypothetical protein
MYQTICLVISSGHRGKWSTGSLWFFWDWWENREIDDVESRGVWPFKSLSPKGIAGLLNRYAAEATTEEESYPGITEQIYGSGENGKK